MRVPRACVGTVVPKSRTCCARVSQARKVDKVECTIDTSNMPCRDGAAHMLSPNNWHASRIDCPFSVHVTLQANGVSSLDYKEHVATGVYFLYLLYGMQQLERRASWMSYTQI